MVFDSTYQRKKLCDFIQKKEEHQNFQKDIFNCQRRMTTEKASEKICSILGKMEAKKARQNQSIYFF